MADHRRWRIWRVARALAIRVHGVVMALPQREQRRRGDQLIRSANSVRNNISEGACGTDPQLAKALGHSLGSANEAIDQLDDLEAVGLLHADNRDLIPAYLELAAMIAAFRQAVIRRIPAKKKRGANAPRRPTL